MSVNILNPRPMLQGLTGNLVQVRLKWGMEYRGYLQSVDSFFNLQLVNAEEIITETESASLGEILIRCNNILYIRGVESTS